MQSHQPIKICFSNEVRRILINQDMTFDDLVKQINVFFPGITGSVIHLLWKDDEGDDITVSSNIEFMDAIQTMLSCGYATPKFQVKIQGEPKMVEAKHNLGPNDQSHSHRVHKKISCDECGAKPILGVRYKCTVRNNFDLCSNCEAKSVQPYPMVKIVRPRQRPDNNHFVYQMINGNVGPTPPVSFQEQAEFMHRHVRCDECNTFPIVGTRFKCTSRADFDLCSSCEKKKTQPFPMVKIYDPKHNPSLVMYSAANDTKVIKVEVPQVAIPMHRGVTCDECGAKPIVGDRYKCTVRNNFDLCSNCEAKSVQPYPMVKIVRPDTNHFVYQMINSNVGPTPPVSFQDQAEFTHRHVRCDECNIFPIVGTRFKCTSRADFDLCSSCEKKKTQPFPMVKIYDPKHHPIAPNYNVAREEGQGRSVKFFDRVFPNCHARRHFYQPNPLRFNDRNCKNGHGPRGYGPFVRAMDNPAPTSDATKLAMRFVKDVTYPDGTSVAPVTVMVKTWTVRNDGLCDWPLDVFLVSAGGDELSREGAAAAVGLLRVGEEKDLSVSVVAPTKAGRYVSYYRLQTKEGRNFGQRLWADFVVTDSETSDAAQQISVTESPAEIVVANNASETGLSTAAEVPEEEDGAWVSVSPTEEGSVIGTVVASVVPDMTQIYAEDVDSDEDDEELFSPSHSTVYWEEADVPSEATAVLEESSNVDRWAKELALFEEMGFSDTLSIVPLLEMHVGTPGHAAINTAGLQQVVAILLGLNSA